MWGLLPESRRRVLRHAHECPACRKVLESGGEGEVGRPLPRIQPNYERILDRVLRSLEPRIRQAEREQAEAPALLAELVRHLPSRREMLIRNARRFRSFSLCLRLLDQSREVSPDDPRGGEEWALLTLRLIDLLKPEFYGRGLLDDVRARAWTFLANARRIAGDLLGAERAFEWAEKYLRQGTRDRLERAQLLVCKASLRRLQRRFEESERLLRRALSIWLSAGESRRAVEAMLTWSVIYKEYDEPERGIRLLREASGLPAALSDPHLALAIHHNMALFLIHAGKFLEAEGMLLHNHDVYDRLRARGARQWAEGLLARELGRMSEAEARFRGLREMYLKQGKTYETAAVNIELALVCLSTGQVSDAEDLAREALAVFIGLGLERDAFAAYLLAQRAGARAIPRP